MGISRIRQAFCDYDCQWSWSGSHCIDCIYWWSPFWGSSISPRRFVALNNVSSLGRNGILICTWFECTLYTSKYDTMVGFIENLVARNFTLFLNPSLIHHPGNSFIMVKWFEGSNTTDAFPKCRLPVSHCFRNSPAVFFWCEREGCRCWSISTSCFKQNPGTYVTRSCIV